MSEIVQSPGSQPAVGIPTTEDDTDKLHSEAFRDLEGEIHDLGLIGEIAEPLIMTCTVGKADSMRKLELAQFAVLRLTKMLKEFEANYQKRWHNEPLTP